MDCKSAIIVSERILKTLIKKLNATKSYETKKSVAIIFAEGGRNMNSLRFDTLIIALIISLMMAIGTIALLGGVVGVAVIELETLSVLGMILGLTGINFGIILYMYLIERN